MTIGHLVFLNKNGEVLEKDSWIDWNVSRFKDYYL